MQQPEERRVSGVRRVPVERIVDVCGQAAPFAAFQGRSVNISGRGMQIWAKHLPELYSPIVLRFQEQGSEVIAEGEVAWCKPGSGGGDFGVRFTALDSRSVQALKALCQGEGHAEVDPALAPPDRDGDTEPVPPAGDPVKLHIDGLEAPMRAHVRRQNQRAVQVTSPLEFLRLGRSLEIEDVTVGRRRPARIDSVDIGIDEVSGVPELVVCVRYLDAAESTPRGPSARSSERAAQRTPASGRAAARLEAALSAPGSAVRGVGLHASAGDDDGPASSEAFADPSSAVDSEWSLPPSDLAGELGVSAESGAVSRHGDGDSEDPVPSSRAEPDGVDVDVAAMGPRRSSGVSLDVEAGPDSAAEEDEKLRQRMQGVLSGMSTAARAASSQCARLGGAASRGASWLWTRARAARTAEPAPAPRRRTAAAPRSLNKSLRQAQRSTLRSTVAPAEPAKPSKPRRGALPVVLLGGGLLLVVAGTTIGRSGGSAAPSNTSRAPSAASAKTGATKPASAPTAVPPAVPADAPSESSPEAPPPAGNGASRPLIPTEGNAVEINSDRRVLARGGSSPSPGLGATDAVELAALARVSPREPAADEAPSSKEAPAPATEFGQGRMRLPIIYRLKLDQPGASLQGERTPTGFEVTIPGRRVMESGADITRRDDRIAKVLTKNDADGTRIAFRFRQGIPAYKVRLRKEYVEFFISAP